MTRSRLQRTLRRIYALLVVVLAVSFLAKIVHPVPLLGDTTLGRLLVDAYEFLRDMSLLIATGGVAYIANVYQKRQSFIDALKEEWRDIIAAKSALFTYTQLERPTAEQYLATFCTLSETIDNMRSVYRNVGETDALIGLWRAQTTPDRAEAARHEGISAWIDGATGTVQARRILLDASDRYEVTTVESGALAAAMARHAPAAG